MKNHPSGPSLLTLAVGLLTFGLAACERGGPAGPPHARAAAAAETPSAAVEPQPTAAPDPFTWASAISRVEELRGGGTLQVPEEMRHASDRRVFLATQMADSSEEDYRLPHDQAELIELIGLGQLVPVPALGEAHILYDIGTDAREDPLAHFDEDTGKDVPLYASLAEYEAAAPSLARATRDLAETYYRDPARAEQLFREHRAVTERAANFDGLRYDLANPEDRTRFQVRLLSYMRPEAKDVMLEIARAYHQQFDRLLPVTSLVRTQRYQRRLGRVNRNATKVEIPPHATGMAFDISYKFMAPDEQNFVMEHVARLEREGRVEALRERLNHLHVYAFADGHRPAQNLVAEFLPVVEAAHPGSAPRGARGASARAR
jgi:hypothetical protein